MTPLELLERGRIDVLGRLTYSSNYVFLVKVSLDEEEMLAVYKPQRGERPLWDFPAGTLAAREVAAYLVSEAAGWGLVPATVMRSEGPLGPGSLQEFVEHDPERHYFVLIEERADELLEFAALDVVINNADRKAGHVIEGPEGSLWGVDHGLTFNVEPKLRTVIWAFASVPIPPRLMPGLERLGSALVPEGALAAVLGALLTPAEVTETKARLDAFVAAGHFPVPEGPFSMPWPLV